MGANPCQSEGGQWLKNNLPAALACGHIDDHKFDNGWDYVYCVFQALKIKNIADAQQKAENLNIDFPNNPSKAQLVAGAGAIFDNVLAFAFGWGFIGDEEERRKAEGE